MWHCTCTVPHDITRRKAVNSRNEVALYRDLLNSLEHPCRLSDIRPIVNQFGLERNISEAGLRRLEGRVIRDGVHKIRLKWKKASSTYPVVLYSVLPDEKINPLRVALAIIPKGYLCYQTALFWNGLTEQIPQTFYIAQERPAGRSLSRLSREPIVLDDMELRDAFVKRAHEYGSIATFGEYRYIVLARAHSGRAGVISKTVHFRSDKVAVSITGIERTILDCITVPEYAGGISNVIEATRIAAKDVSIDRLYKLYLKLNLKYPHWQRVGLIFDRLGFSNVANEWKTHFGNPKNKFYIAKGYRLEWEFDQTWNVYFPRGLFR